MSAQHTNGVIEFGAAPLAGTGAVASWQRCVKDVPLRTRKQPALQLVSCATAEDSVYVPAASFAISGVDALLALRAAIDEALQNEPRATGDAS